MLSDEIDEEKRGTKVPRTRRRKSQPALWGASWSSERSSYRVIESECRSPMYGRCIDHMERKSACKTRGHRTLWTDVGRADVGIKSRRNGRRRNGVCQTPATAKKKKPDGFQNWLHVHNACWRIGQHDPVAMLGQGERTTKNNGRP